MRLNGAAKATGLLLTGGAAAFILAAISGLVQWGATRAELTAFHAHVEEAKPLIQRFVIVEAMVQDLKKTNEDLLHELRGLRSDLDRLLGARTAERRVKRTYHGTARYVPRHPTPWGEE